MSGCQGVRNGVGGERKVNMLIEEMLAVIELSSILRCYTVVLQNVDHWRKVGKVHTVSLSIYVLFKLHMNLQLSQ